VPRSETQAVPKWFGDALERELRSWLSLTDRQIRLLHRHYELLELWNKKINLTTVAPGLQTVIRHYCESLFFGAHLPGNPQTASIADVGSGAGFPGIPLAILNDKWRIALIESNHRKAVFLREASRELANVSVIASRAEDISAEFDWMVSRAVDSAEVIKNARRLAAQIGLMLSESDFSRIKSTPGIAWSKAIQLPWGDRRICAYGVVSRGT